LTGRPRAAHRAQDFGEQERVPEREVRGPQGVAQGHRRRRRGRDRPAVDRNGAMKGGFLALGVALVACSGARSEHYGFVTVLGRDTVAVESVARAPGSFTSDEVDHWPAVRI